APDVTVDDQKWLVLKERQRLADAPCGFQCSGFCRVVQLGAILLPVAQCRDDLFTQPRVIDDDVINAGSHQALDVPDDQRLAANPQQWFGCGVGKGAHALAAPRSKNHGAHQKVYPVVTDVPSILFSMRSNGSKSPYRQATCRI